MLRVRDPFRIYPYDWEKWERLIWFHAERPVEGTLVLWKSRPFVKGERLNVMTFTGPWGEFSWLEEQDEIMGKYIKKSLEKATSVGGVGGEADPSFKKAYPALAEFLTDTDGGDGNRRELSRMTVFFEHGQFKVFLNDIDSQRSLCVSSATFSGLWGALEGTITSDSPGWRDLPQKGAKRGKSP